MQNTIDSYIKSIKTVLENISESSVLTIVELLLNARQENKTIYLMGNGGSGLAASHFVADIGKSASYGKDKKFKVVCLNDNMSMVMSYANDVDYSKIFVEQLKNFLCEGDIVIGFSGSGNSQNVLNAIKYANENRAITVGFTGYDGGKLGKLAKYTLNSKINDIQISEDFHLMMIHLIMKIINNLDEKK